MNQNKNGCFIFYYYLMQLPLKRKKVKLAEKVELLMQRFCVVHKT